MNEASVGYQCPECVRAGRKSVRRVTGRFGGTPSSDPHVTTITLIGINVAVWLAVTATGGSGSRLLEKLSLIPSGFCEAGDGRHWFPGLTSSAMCQAQGTGHDWVPGVADGAWWQLITSVFTHQEIWHIGFNMVALWFLGPTLEAALGRVRFLAVYLVSGLAGSAAVMLWAAPHQSTLGASGAIFGVLGALLVVGWRLHAPMQMLWFWLGLNVIYTFLGANISWQGHLGGLVGGVLVGLGMVLPGRRARVPVQAGAVAAVTVVAVLVSVLRAGALSG